MASWLSRFSPISSFSEYHGPYPVGTVDVEIPTSDLPHPCEAPQDAAPTVAFRIFYPCVKPASSADRPVRWIPQPQRPTVAALIQFLGLTNRKSNALSYLTQWFYYININAHRNAAIRDAPTSNGRWPVTFFSHGLAGSRNAYSYICGDMASNGMVVVAMDHRDGSSPVQYVRATDEREAYSIPAIKVPHDASREVWEARDKQLRIRLYEISLVYEALLKIDGGERLNNMDENTSYDRKSRVEVLQRFKNTLDTTPGKVSWAGHSFGACTMAQLTKSIFYAPSRSSNAGDPLIPPNPTASISQQITPESPVILLDMWGLPFQSPLQNNLWDLPMPSYAENGPQGSNIISILSEGFANWTSNTNTNKHIVAPPAASSRWPSRAEKRPMVPQWAKLRDESPGRDSGYGSEQSPARSPARRQSPAPSEGPYMFYVEKSQHFSQSDFGILFPMLSRRLANAEDPEGILELNARAIVEMLRRSGTEVAGEADAEILNPEGDIGRWRAISVGQGEAKGKVAMGGDEDVAPRDDLAIARTKTSVET